MFFYKVLKEASDWEYLKLRGGLFQSDSATAKKDQFPHDYIHQIKLSRNYHWKEFLRNKELSKTADDFWKHLQYWHEYLEKLYV